jgi:hypothetical protein
VNALAERLEVHVVGGWTRLRFGAVEQQIAKSLTVLLATKEVAYELTGRPVTTTANLTVDEGLQVLRE